MSRILILGGTGFIGSEVSELLNQDHDVTVASQSDIGNVMVPWKFIRIQYDYENFRQLFAINQYDTILFLSGNPYPANSVHSPIYEIRNSYEPFLSLLEAVRGFNPEAIVWCASSVAVYGANCSIPLREESDLMPLSFYGLAKKQMEEYLQYYVRVHNIRGGIFRIFSTFGPKLKRQLIFDIFRKMKSGEGSISLFGDGTESRDFSYVVDQARAISFLVKSVIPKGDVYNLGSGQLYSVNEIATKIAGILNVRPDICYTEKRSFDGQAWKADVSKISDLGFNQIYSIDKGLQVTISELLRNA